ncbi:class I SAM-dependent methyltransferase [Litchfieldella rifensis]|uniref:Class I SAM-dependent methyltransferase n=1 Tax=Litchfieldella rifensis TaxID=762643 RepID=A0ABV7LSB2_9GAMM
MSIMQSILLRTFGRPRGVLGRLGGAMMARMNEDCGTWVIDLLEVAANDRVLEIGFGPGVVIQHLSNRVSTGHVAGIDPSHEMVEQAGARNAAAIHSGRVELRHGSVENLPFEDGSFDKVLAINSMQVWADAEAGLREVRRVLRSGGSIALGFTPYSGQSPASLPETLMAAGFTKAHVREKDKNFCVLAIKP